MTQKVKLLSYCKGFFHITEDVNSYQWASNSIKVFPTIHVRSANTKFGKYMHKYSTRILTTCFPAVGSVVMAKKREIKFTRCGFV